MAYSNLNCSPIESCPLANLGVIVTSTTDGKPISGVTVDVSGPECRTGTTDNDGRVEFLKLLPACYDVAASLNGGTTEHRSVTLSESSSQSLVLSLKLEKSVTVRITSLTFRSDHLDDKGKKLIKHSVKEEIKVAWIAGRNEIEYMKQESYFGDKYVEFLKPEWEASRGGSDSYPISHTKAKPLEVDIEVEFKIIPDGESSNITKIWGVSSEFGISNKKATQKLTFAKQFSNSVKTGKQLFETIRSNENLPDSVQIIDSLTISWYAMVDGEQRRIGLSGPHKIFATLDKPFGRMEYRNKVFDETGENQIVTDTRLEYAIDAARGKVREEESVDEVFSQIGKMGVGYTLDRRWEDSAFSAKTGIEPKPTLHHYLWLCNTHNAQGECHIIAAGFILACRILGVNKSFKVGFMYPWPSREDKSPHYPRSRRRSAKGNPILGKLNEPARRNHVVTGLHDTIEEQLMFIDGNGFPNFFEGVAVYQDHVLFAVGEGKYSDFDDPHDNASIFYSFYSKKHRTFDRGAFPLFWATPNGQVCSKPYPSATQPAFRWED